METKDILNLLTLRIAALEDVVMNKLGVAKEDFELAFIDARLRAGKRPLELLESENER